MRHESSNRGKARAGGWQGRARGLAGGVGALMALSCSHHVKLAVPGTTGSSLYICEKGGCRPSEIDAPALLNQSGTAFIVLPAECHGRFNEITVLDAGSNAPRVFARCAPSENPLGEMAARSGAVTDPAAAPLEVMGEAVESEPAPSAGTHP